MYWSGPVGSVDDVPSPVNAMAGISTNTLDARPLAFVCTAGKAPACAYASICAVQAAS
ncbi:MAG: hypothetical protein QM753_20175 [Thermomicrobiales bacterium]